MHQDQIYWHWNPQDKSLSKSLSKRRVFNLKAAVNHNLVVHLFKCTHLNQAMWMWSGCVGAGKSQSSKAVTWNCSGICSKDHFAQHCSFAGLFSWCQKRKWCWCSLIDHKSWMDDAVGFSASVCLCFRELSHRPGTSLLKLWEVKGSHYAHTVSCPQIHHSQQLTFARVATNQECACFTQVNLKRRLAHELSRNMEDTVWRRNS